MVIAAQHRGGVGSRRRLAWPVAGLLLVIASLVAGFGGIAPTGAAPGSTTTSASTPTVVGWSCAATCTDPTNGSAWEITVYRPVNLVDTEHMGVAPGMKLVGVGVAATLKQGTPVEMGSAWFRLKDSEGIEYDHEFVPGQKVPQLQARTLYSGQTVMGYMIVEIPETADIVAAVCDTDSFGYGDPAFVWTD